MRAPVQKKRPGSKNGTREETPGDPQAPDKGARRPVRVRTRLVGGVALVSLTVLAAGAPAVLGASAELKDAQQLVDLAALDRQAVTLAHSLADERDEVVAYVAAGRDEQRGPAKNKRKITPARAARVDRQIDEIRPDAPADLRHDLAAVSSVRRSALTGKGTALEAFKAYTDVITKLQALADRLAERTPPEIAEATRAPAALGRAVEQASATRALLLADLAVPEPKDGGSHFDPATGTMVPDENEDAAAADRARTALGAAAQQARIRELTALADFDQAASAEGRDSLATNVTGPEVKQAENYLAKLTDDAELTRSERRTDPARLDAALSARIEQLRGVESAFATAQVQRLETVRDDQLTALELRIGLLGGCLLVAIGVSAAVARTLTQPLAVLRIGAARLAAAPEPQSEEPVRYTGRNDEFAQVVRSLNSLQGKLAGLAGQVERLDGDRADLAGAREVLAAELTARRAELQEQTALLTAELEQLRHTVRHTFVNLSLRTLGLVERQLGVIEKLEEREQDPDRLATLFKLDHMATVMRRHSENLLILAGHEHIHGHPGPVPLVDVLRAAVSEIERYERVTIQSLPPHAQIAGFAADDLSHLVAELLENATAFSPPDAQVQLSGWLLESGEVMLSVQDEGIGMTEGRLAELNARLAEPDPEDSDADLEGEGLGIRVTALLAARLGVRVQLREQKQGGVAAVIVLPQPLLPDAPPAAVPPPVPVAGGPAPTLNLPGSVAEANSNALPERTRDPLIAAAEQAVEAAEREQAETPAAPEPEATEPEAPEAEAVSEAEPETDAEAGVPEESRAETTLQVRLPLAPEAEPESESEFEPASDAEPEPEAVHVPAPAPAPEPEPEAPAPSPYAIGPDAHERAAEPYETVADAPRVTDKGLPKRTPRVLRQADAPVPRQAGGVDAEALRARLGGFHQGAKDGRRDVEAEIARTEETGTGESAGDTVEEARS
ncbi:nitrate- and nitrite sensing domain-containing protein [Streptomyces solicathayae]|uniref:histidine kinase n=1 Tax=Streptomyces solicathayae TaxID=3081768 RepID=A0ABZ0LRL4_9ACTN|nr:nitrate- and nitrite sensing domain-containing protein [Streptomyces sp. HUAS YS2]WOX22096.1 nitrate- and nitrite sensing domain-containing protein [Streptomyces sp. HUAS YS2]